MKPIVFLVVTALNCATAQPQKPVPVLPVPETRQLEWQQMEYYGFLHFSLNTFTDKEWGYGDEPELLFAPGDFDAEQIVPTAKLAGMG
jgi:alpha-L-fucosidase